MSAGKSEKDVSRRRVSTDRAFRLEHNIIIIVIPSPRRDLFVFNLRDQSHEHTQRHDTHFVLSRVL